ncbi:MAG: sigma-70 family RNA polymerase sigma factor [Planctomycetes bacterium]|nr:sigma-70 family RNA polymerase sigma factor [Planctomycetota bacterium]
MCDDGELLAQVAGPDLVAGRASLEALYARHAAALLGLLRRGAGEDAEDLLHETFLIAARRAQSFRGRDARAWLATLALNRLRDWARREAWRRRASAGPPPPRRPRRRGARRATTQRSRARWRRSPRAARGGRAAPRARPPPRRRGRGPRRLLRTAKQRSADALARCATSWSVTDERRRALRSPAPPAGACAPTTRRVAARVRGAPAPAPARAARVLVALLLACGAAGALWPASAASRAWGEGFARRVSELAHAWRERSEVLR